MKQYESLRCPSGSGFTLLESLVALLVATVVLLPAGLWLYRSKANAVAWERFQALQALEFRMHRTLLLGEADAGLAGGAESCGGCSLDIRRLESGGETRISGKILDRKGRVLVTLETVVFPSGGP